MALADKIWWTKKARIQAAERLRKRSWHAQNLLIWYSFAAVSASVYFLKYDPGNDLAQVAMVIYSISGSLHVDIFERL